MARNYSEWLDYLESVATQVSSSASATDETRQAKKWLENVLVGVAKHANALGDYSEALIELVEGAIAVTGPSEVTTWWTNDTVTKALGLLRSASDLGDLDPYDALRLDSVSATLNAHRSTRATGGTGARSPRTVAPSIEGRCEYAILMSGDEAVSRSMRADTANSPSNIVKAVLSRDNSVTQEHVAEVVAHAIVTPGTHHISDRLSIVTN
jgi:hypothetical protein